jgi:hypothetical protein
MIISYAIINLSMMKIILSEMTIKEGVTYGLCFRWWNSYYLRICHEARLKKCSPTIIFI